MAFGAGFMLNKTTRLGSRLSIGVRSYILSTLVLVDGNKVLGYPIGAISDYIAMLTLSQLRLTDGCGVLPNSVEATVRMAGNLGFRTYLVADACFTFARRDYHGRLRTADEVHSMSLANLHDEYCIVLDTASVLADS
jgi:hypothetical protein